MSKTVFAIQERAVSENTDVGPQGKGWQEDIAYTLEARNKVQAVCGAASGSVAVPANDNAPQLPLRFLSVCSGIEAASVAWHPLGWRAVAFSEIEKFPSAVLAHHYPDVPNLGDFTKINTKTLGRVDILAGGTPCQAFSVAGLRKGLDDARGNLTLKFVELAHELADGNGLRNVVWENVVGVLSDKGNAFGCFLAGLVGADSAIQPPSRGKWPTHGMVSGPKGRAAWAVKDAQYFGVAQRRRRVLVVADFGNGADPAAVLFEPESVCRNSPPSREAGKSVAPTISARTTVNSVLTFKVVVQCKRYRDTVGANDLRNFRGAMQGRTDKALFITTGTFTRGALEEATRDGVPEIDLINGEDLTAILKELKLGIKTEMVERVSVVKEFFAEI